MRSAGCGVGAIGCTLIFGGALMLGYLLGGWHGVEVAAAVLMVLIGSALVWTVATDTHPE